MYCDFQSCQNSLDGVQAIDYYLARQLSLSIATDTDISETKLSLLFHSIIACSEALREGHTCLKLSQIAGCTCWQNKEEHKSGYQFPDAESWQQSLIDYNINPDNNHPLVYEYQRLYLRRYWKFETELAASLCDLINRQLPLDIKEAKNVIELLFPSSQTSDDQVDWQKVAVANALQRQFSIIAGGPGTGKTFTVTKLLAALQALSTMPLKIAMVAPTGKAAQRLNESIQKAKAFLFQQQLLAEDIINAIPDTASTVHRLLGVIPGSHDFRYNENKPLNYDVLLVDEISMIDLPLMARLFRALADNSRVIMLGDADQLPSVAAGSVLADLTPLKGSLFSAANSRFLESLTGHTLPVQEPAYDHLTVLQKSHRFEGGGEIGQLAGKVIDGCAESSWKSLVNGRQQISLAHSGAFSSWVEQLTEKYYVPLLESARLQNITVQKALEQFNQFRFLAATRLGEQGVAQLNELVENYLLRRGLIASSNGFYPGRPIMVTENQYHLGLYNGDIGLLWLNDQKRLQAAFPHLKQGDDNAETIKWLSPGRLPEIETVYAMTIHKTQGSEFNQVALVMPQQDSPILSRELLYTAITRASEQLVIWSDKPVWELSVNRKVQRYSGLQKRIFGPS